jgi:hypothetical protein
VTAQPHAHVRFRRAIERRALWLAEDAARGLPNLPLEDLLQLVHLYAERGSPKYEKAALRWLERYLTEGSPRLQHFAEITAGLAKRASRKMVDSTQDAPAKTFYDALIGAGFGCQAVLGRVPTPRFGRALE